MTVASLRKKVDGVLKKGHELLEASSSLRREKVELKEKLLSQLLKLQKVSEEVCDLQEKFASAQLEISSLRKQIDRGYLEKLALDARSACCWVVWRVMIRMWKS